MPCGTATTLPDSSADLAHTISCSVIVLSICAVNMPQFLATAARDIPTFAGAKYTHNNLEEAAQCLGVKNGTLGFFLGCDHVGILNILCNANEHARCK